MVDLNQARDVLALDEGQLYALFALGSPEYSRAARADFSPRVFGERLFNEMQARLEKAICPRYCKERHNWIAEDGAEAAIVIAGCIEEHLLGYPALTLAAIVVKRGLKTLCTCQ